MLLRLCSTEQFHGFRKVKYGRISHSLRSLKVFGIFWYIWLDIGLEKFMSALANPTIGFMEHFGQRSRLSPISSIK